MKRSRHHLRRHTVRRRGVAIIVIATAVMLAALGIAAKVGAPSHIWHSVAGALGPAPVAAPMRVAPIGDGHALGIAAGSSLPSLTDAQLAARLDGIQATGSRWIRLDFDWSNVQPTSADTYNWMAYDRLVREISARHLAILGILDYTPAWARPATCTSSSQCAPNNDAQFATFAATVARRYSSRGVHYWEVWNEPNNPSFWRPAANPSQYAGLLCVTYTALRAADSSAYIIMAGLSPQATASGAYSPYDFLAAVYTDGGKGCFDAVGDHPYTFPLSPSSSENQAWAQMAAPNHSLRSLMVANGDGAKKIWITEFGAPTGGPGPVATLQHPNLAAQPYVVDQALQAKILSDALQLYASYPWAGPFLYYTYQDPGTDPSTNENFFGLVTTQGAQKQAYAVFRSATEHSAN